MIVIKRDLIISSAIVAVSLLALAWFFLLSAGFTDTAGPHGIALVLGGLGAVIMTPFWFGFLKAARVYKALVSGKGVIGRWQLSPEQVAAFVAMKHYSSGKTQGVLWRPSKQEQRNGTEIVFGAEAVCVGGRILFLPTAGIQSIRGISVEPGYPQVLSIWVKTNTMRNDRRHSYYETLRVPVGSSDAWLKVLTHYRQALSGAVVVAPGRWLWRIRIGIGLMVVLPLLGLYGWYLASRPDRRTDEELILPLIFMMLGIIGTIGAGIVVLMSWEFRERQFGRRKR